MNVKTYPKSAVAKMLADLGVDDPESVTQIVIDPGHVTVVGLDRDELDLFQSHGAKPSLWNRVFPIDFES